MKNEKSGMILINVLVFGVIAIIVVTALINWGVTMIKDSRQLSMNEQAFQIADSGIDYYLTHINNSQTDYNGGIFDFKDKDGNVIGHFELTVTPPVTGSTLVTVQSKGTVAEDATISKIIKASIAIPTFANRVFTANYPLFKFGRQFPIASVNFQSITSALVKIKADAISGGNYFPSSGVSGYHIILKTDGTFDLYSVDALILPPLGFLDVGDQDGWGTLGIDKETFISNYSLPANGIIFADDDTWVEGQINNVRLTIASSKNININKDILYTNYDGRDTLALIAQRNISVGENSNDILRIDSALLARNQRVGRYYYSDGWFVHARRTKITINGIIATNKDYGFSYFDGTGYNTVDIIYDKNLLHFPPPDFPLTSNQYSIISWQEIK